MERIKVIVEQIAPGRVWTYRKPDTKWTILQVVRADSKQKCTAKGIVEFEPKHGDLLELEGDWKKSTFAGSMGKDEFCFKTAMLNIPTDSRALLHYACTLTKGIGPVKESEIWEAYGESWQKETGLSGIKGISEEIAWNWQETLRRLGEHAEQTQAITLLLSKGATLNMANAAWERWKHETTGTVTENCYRLCDLPHYGFQDVDESIRVAFGIGDEDPRRVEAAVLYVIEQATGNGDTVVPMTAVTEKVCDMVRGAKGKLDAAVKVLVDRGDVVVLAGNMLALTGDMKAEQAAWDRFKVA